MTLCNGVHEKNQHHFVIKDIAVVMNTFLGNTIYDTSFGDAIINIYDEMVLKMFISISAKPHVKKVDGQTLYMRFRNGVNEKFQHHFVINDIMVVM